FSTIEELRFTNSGTEAVMMAVRAARAFTGRDLIVKAAGGYHGAWEQGSLSSDGTSAASAEGAESSARPARLADSGIPRSVRDLVRLVTYNATEELEALFSDVGDTVAALILEPVIGEEAIAGTHEFLATARKLADQHGAVLIFDEVVTAR